MGQLRQFGTDTINLAGEAMGVADDVITSSDIVNDTIVSDDISPTVIKTVVFPLSSANIKAMFGNPIAIVAGVAGKSIVVDDVTIAMSPTATHYTGGGDVMVGTADKDMITAIPKALILSTATGETIVSNAKGQDFSASDSVGLQLSITNADGAFATGTGTAVVTVRYHLV